MARDSSIAAWKPKSILQGLLLLSSLTTFASARAPQVEWKDIVRRSVPLPAANREAYFPVLNAKAVDEDVREIKAHRTEKKAIYARQSAATTAEVIPTEYPKIDSVEVAKQYIVPPAENKGGFWSKIPFDVSQVSIP